MKEISKVYYIQEAELCILLALKGTQILYGLRLNSDASMTQEALFLNLFAMQKKGILSRSKSSDTFLIEEDLDSCVELIQAADRFLVLAGSDELTPEQYFYIAGKEAVMLQPVGQYDAVQPEGAFHMEKMPEDAMWDRIRESGFGLETEQGIVPQSVRMEAQKYQNEDKEMILQHPAVDMILQEYDVHTQRKKKQWIKFVCGLDMYVVCSDALQGGEKS